MRLKEAYQRINQIKMIPFRDLFSETALQTILVNKGRTGQLLELALGMPLSNANIDFEDGELKTNKCDITGKPKETVFITQISGIIDELIEKKSFEETHLYAKIKNILYVPVCKDGTPSDWMFLNCIHVDLSSSRFHSLNNIWANDYYSICQQIRQQIEISNNSCIHTANGTHLQIRSKDSMSLRGGYHPIYSTIYNRYVSNKNYAFYFKKEFVYDIKRRVELSE